MLPNVTLAPHPDEATEITYTLLSQAYSGPHLFVGAHDLPYAVVQVFPPQPLALMLPFDLGYPLPSFPCLVVCAPGQLMFEEAGRHHNENL